MARELKYEWDDNTAIGYDYINQEYYVKNLDTRTVAISAEDAKRVFEIIAVPNPKPDEEDYEFTVAQIKTLSAPASEEITVINYTLEDNGRYIKTISFNEYTDLAMQYNEPYLFIRGTNEMWDISSTIGADSVSMFMHQFYTNYVGLKMDRLLMDAIISYYRKIQNPYVYNVIAPQTDEQKDNGEPLMYTNKMVMNNANKLSAGEYDCTKNPNELATLNTYDVESAIAGSKVITCKTTPECNIGDIIQLTSDTNYQDNLIVDRVFGNNIYVTDPLTKTYNNTDNAKVYTKAYGIIKAGYNDTPELTESLQIQSIDGTKVIPIPYITENSYGVNDKVTILDKEYTVKSIVPTNTTTVGDKDVLVKGYIILDRNVEGYSSYTYTYGHDPLMLETYKNSRIHENSITLSTILDVVSGDKIEIVNSGDSGINGIYTVDYTEGNKVYILSEDNKELPEYTFPENNKAMVQFRRPSDQILLNMTHSNRPDKLPLGEFMLDNDTQLTQYLELRYITPPTPQNYACLNSTVIKKYYLTGIDGQDKYMDFIGLFSDIYEDTK